MVFLSLTLKPKVNRWANITFGVLYTFVNIGNLIGETWDYYIFFGIVEIACILLIVWHAWKWSGNTVSSKIALNQGSLEKYL